MTRDPAEHGDDLDRRGHRADWRERLGERYSRPLPSPSDSEPTQLQLFLLDLDGRAEAFRRVDDQLGDPEKLTDAGRHFYAESVLQAFADFAQFADTKARNYACRAILDGDMSRKTAAGILGVHQATIARWVKDFGGIEADPSRKLPPHEDEAYIEDVYDPDDFVKKIIPGVNDDIDESSNN